MLQTEEKKDNDLSRLYKYVDNDFVYNGITQRVTLIDLRNWDKYTKCHIYKAIHVSMEPIYLEPQTKDDIITNVSQLICSHPQKLKIVYGKLVILYGDSDTNEKYYNFLLQLIDKQNCGNFKYFVLKHTFNEFQSQYPYLCVWDEKIINTSSINKPLFNQKYIDNDENDESKKELEESNITTYKRYNRLLLECGYPNIIFPNKLYIGDGRQAMNWTVIYNLKITHILNVTRLVPNQFNGDENNMKQIKNDLLPSVYKYFLKYPVKYLQLKLLDIDKESFEPYFDSAFEFIDNAMNMNNGNNNNKILIHCQMGISRSSTMLIGYLMHFKKWSLVDAYQHVKQCRNCISPNNGFLKQLVILEKKLFDGKSTLDEIEKRGIKDLKHYKKFIKGEKGGKQRNEAKMLQNSLQAFVVQQKKIT